MIPIKVFVEASSVPIFPIFNLCPFRQIIKVRSWSNVIFLVNSISFSRYTDIGNLSFASLTNSSSIYFSNSFSFDTG